MTIFYIPLYSILNTHFIIGKFKFLHDLFHFPIITICLRTSAACKGFFVTFVLILKLFIIFNISVIFTGLEEQMLKISNFYLSLIY